ncbi:short-chain fatty acid transporter [Robiginitalea aurantiaca]|uniref:TIGR00366 family protein n=1 Tax=Robiginitalea aurantiaca TaxID=3056915 RepID=A0ABT7WEL2_9FLAO|nr:TIGR00366 family protein [Robiginitalea aurantiaca]MDM9631355.1 TIGR00366 family protein [Robiginitalea aurantiaca]
MSLTRTVELVFRRFLPSPFVIALILTLVTMGLALVFGKFPQADSSWEGMLGSWEKGLWNRELLVFAYQMMLILVLGHVLVLSKPMERLIIRLTSFSRDGASAALLVASATMLVSFFNWGLGLIFGAILARKVGEYAQKQQIPVNYPLIGACGYVGLMIWHGGISGSAPIKVSEPGHLANLMGGASGAGGASLYPETIPTSLTIFSVPNLIIFFLVFTAISSLVYYLGRKVNPTHVSLPVYAFSDSDTSKASGAERLDRSPVLSTLFGALIFLAFLVQYLPQLKSLNLTPDMLNFFMLGLAILLHGSIRSFLQATQEAIGDTAGILIQFPLYFGIMGIMTESGLIHQISDFFVAISTERTFPLFTFFSAGLVNIFVPSGGGQWAVQGPVILEAAQQLGVSLPKAVMAISYGDQLTNMLQPFWALPLLGITRLKAREILPYTMLFMLVGGVIYLAGLWFS